MSELIYIGPTEDIPKIGGEDGARLEAAGLDVTDEVLNDLAAYANARDREGIRARGLTLDKMGGLPLMQGCFYALCREGLIDPESRSWLESAWDEIGEWLT